MGTGEVEILLAASCYGNRDKLRPDELVGSKGITFFFFTRNELCGYSKKDSIYR